MDLWVHNNGFFFFSIVYNSWSVNGDKSSLLVKSKFSIFWYYFILTYILTVGPTICYYTQQKQICQEQRRNSGILGGILLVIILTRSPCIPACPGVPPSPCKTVKLNKWMESIVNCVISESHFSLNRTKEGLDRIADGLIDKLTDRPLGWRTDRLTTGWVTYWPNWLTDRLTEQPTNY